jgi:DNA-binding MarR family transcriptional regulator
MVDDRDRPIVQVFANSEPALARMRRTAEMAECRTVSALPLESGADPAACAVPGAAILIELDDAAAGEAALPLLDWLQREAERGARRGVVSAPASLIDLVAASVGHAGIAHLGAADEAERVAAVVSACQPAAARVRDMERGSGARVLQPAPDYAADSGGRAEAALIRALVRVRRARAAQLPADLFADPVWDMLLDLMAARLEGKKVAVSSLCAAAAVPPTTALRWIGVMAERGLIARVADPGDRRRAHVELAPATARAMLAWLVQMRRTMAEVL